MTIQLIKPFEARLTAGGPGIQGQRGVLYQTVDETPAKLYVWDGEKHVALPGLSSDGSLANGDEAYGLATAGTPGTTLTDTGTGYAAPCEFWGIEVSAYNGGPQTVVVRNGGAGGAIVATFTVSGVGFYSYSGDWAAPGNGQNLSRAMSTDVHLTITGGTSRTVTAIVEA